MPKKTVPKEPMRIVDAKAAPFRKLKKLTSGMTPAERAKFMIQFVGSLQCIDPATGELEPESEKHRQAKANWQGILEQRHQKIDRPGPSDAATPPTGADADSIFSRMAKLPTPMAPDPEPGLLIGGKAPRRRPK